MNMTWYSVFSFLFLCLETTLYDSNWDKTTCVAVMFFFPKVSFHKYLITTMFKVFYPQLQTPWQGHLKDTLQLKIFWTSVSSLHQDIELIIVCFSFSQTSLVFKFNLMLIEQFLPQFIYLSIFWYCILKFIQYLYAFFIRASKFSWASMLFFCEGLQLQNVIIFLFSMKH